MIKQNKNSNEDSLKNIKNSVPKMKETKKNRQIEFNLPPQKYFPC